MRPQPTVLVLPPCCLKLDLTSVTNRQNPGNGKFYRYAFEPDPQATRGLGQDGFTLREHIKHVENEIEELAQRPKRSKRADPRLDTDELM